MIDTLSRVALKDNSQARVPACFFFRPFLLQKEQSLFGPLDEDNEKNRNKIGAKMKTLEAKPFDQNAEN